MLFDDGTALFDSAQVFDAYETTVTLTGVGTVNGLAYRLKYYPLTVVGGVGTAVLVPITAYGVGQVALHGIATIGVAMPNKIARPPSVSLTGVAVEATMGIVFEPLMKAFGTGQVNAVLGRVWTTTAIIGAYGAVFADVMKVRYSGASVSGVGNALGIYPRVTAGPHSLVASGTGSANLTGFAQTHSVKMFAQGSSRSLASASRVMYRKPNETKTFGPVLAELRA